MRVYTEGFSDSELATLLGAFFPGYLLTQIPAGILATRVGGKIVLTSNMASMTSSLATQLDFQGEILRDWSVVPGGDGAAHAGDADGGEEGRGVAARGAAQHDGALSGVARPRGFPDGEELAADGP